jgi:hypothetical protein
VSEASAAPQEERERLSEGTIDLHRALDEED